MKKNRLLLVVALSLALVAGLVSLTACFGSGGVAATVNGTKIMEQDITDAIESMRAQNPDYNEPAIWAQALASSGLTPETLRESVIKTKAEDIILIEEAGSQGFVIEDSEIDDTVAQTRTTVGAEDDDAAWLEILKSYGYKDEQAFRDKLKRNDLVTMLYDAYELEPTDVELVSFIAQNPTAVEDYTLPAYEAAVEVAAANAPDADPDATPAPVTVSPDDVDLKSIPESALAQFKELWSNSNKGTAFQDWVKELVDNADIVINEMPANVPYNVDMNLAESDTNSTANPASDSSSPEAVAAARAEGLIIVDDVVGDGDEAVSGSTAYMHYIGTLEDGTVFDKNIEGDNPFEFTLGTQQVIRGWDAGVVGMKVGGKRTLTIPPALGYGDVDHGSIPANSTLKFEVELVEVK